jgi:predicted protein tyrosine phosphatase
MKNFLFICSGAIDRSPCAASLIPGSKFAGVGPLTETPVTKEFIDWADLIICMEFEHKVLLFEKFDEARKKDVEVLNVSNDFLRYDPELEIVLREKLKRFKY